MTRHPEHSEDCPGNGDGHCECWYEGERCHHCQAGSDYRETPARLSLVGKRVVLCADPEEGWPEETIAVEADYEVRKPDGFQRFLQGLMEDGEYTEAPYDQLKEVL